MDLGAGRRRGTGGGLAARKDRVPRVQHADEATMAMNDHPIVKAERAALAEGAERWRAWAVSKDDPVTALAERCALLELERWESHRYRVARAAADAHRDEDVAAGVRIEALEREMAAVRSERDAALAKLAALERTFEYVSAACSRDRDRLRKALRPFAELSAEGAIAVGLHAEVVEALAALDGE